jgi:hypothetical protein
MSMYPCSACKIYVYSVGVCQKVAMREQMPWFVVFAVHKLKITSTTQLSTIVSPSLYQKLSNILERVIRGFEAYRHTCY